MEYKTVAEAKDMPGLRLVLSMGAPGPWGEAAKGILHVKGVPFVPVGQVVAAGNADLVAWTGVRNAPVAVYNSEKPRDRWLDILMLAERLAPTPRLLPEASEDRAVVIGIANEICGEWGFGWCRRNMIVGPPRMDTAGRERPLDFVAEYGCTPDAVAASPRRVAGILTMLTKRLKAQQALGSSYLVGTTLTAADIYWTYFSEILEPSPSHINPVSEPMRTAYAMTSPEVDAAKDPILIAHRNQMYKRHLKVPLDF